MSPGRYLVGQLPWYSVLIVTGMVIAILLAMREEKRLQLPKDTVLDLVLWLLPLGIIGARLYYVAFAWDAFRDSPLRIFAIWEGGLAIYGGLIGGFLAVALTAARKKQPLLTLLDAIVPGVPLAQAIGRWGNFFNMEAYGAAVTDPAWQFFPFAVQIPEAGGIVWHQATFFYESVWDFLCFLTLWLMRKQLSRRGDTFWRYVLLYGAGRALIEGLRTDSLYAGTLRISQLLSVIACVAVCALFGHRLLRGRARAALWPALLVPLAAGLTGSCVLPLGGALCRWLPVGAAVAALLLWLLFCRGETLRCLGAAVLSGLLSAAAQFPLAVQAASGALAPSAALTWFCAVFALQIVPVFFLFDRWNRRNACLPQS